MKIGILYICTGKYDIFRKDFYLSCEKYLLKNHEIHYFVRTDAKVIFDEYQNHRIHKFYQENLGRPNNTLKRFHIFLSQESELQEMDYLFFMNANLEIKTEIWEEILPKEERIVVAQHPYFYNKKNIKFPYERNPLSTAYITKWKGDVYVQGALNGGKTKDFLRMCKVLAKNTDEDLKNNLVAVRHDESHLNKYIYMNTNYRLLNPSYLYPEGWFIPFKMKILIKDKTKRIDINQIKSNKQNASYRLKERSIKKIAFVLTAFYQLFLK